MTDRTAAELLTLRSALAFEFKKRVDTLFAPPSGVELIWAIPDIDVLMSYGRVPWRYWVANLFWKFPDGSGCHTRLELIFGRLTDLQLIGILEQQMRVQAENMRLFYLHHQGNASA